MPFSTANSSFILDLRRLSIRLCAVFLAIFRPAALVADGCFFLDGSLAAGPAALLFPAPLPLVDVVAGANAGTVSAVFFFSSCIVRGFIWIILRDRVGGGGSAKALLLLLLLPSWLAAAAAAADERLRALTASLGCMG